MKLIIILLFLGVNINLIAEEADTKATTKVSPISQLERAYQREFAFLQAQKRSLKKQLKSIDALYTSQIKKAQGEVDALRGKTVRVGLNSQSMSTDFQTLQKNIESLDESEEQMIKVIEQSTESLKSYGVSKATLSVESTNQLAKISERFNIAVTHLNKLSKLIIEDGEFYSKDGTLMKGKVASLGSVAKFGMSGNKSAVLVPSGNGPFKMATLIETGQMDKLFNQKLLPNTLQVFLFDNPNQAVEAKKGKTVLGIINSGGTIAWVIVALGILGLSLVVYRYLMLKKISHFDNNSYQQVKTSLQEGQLEEAIEQSRNQKGSINKLVTVMIVNLKKPKAILEDVFSENYEKERLKTDKLATFIIVIASIAPLLGLLGTVTGMISTFDIITEYGTGDPKHLSGGISEALVTTKLGLVVAIPTLFFGTLLSGWGKKIKSNMETIPLEVFNQFYAEGK